MGTPDASPTAEVEKIFRLTYHEGEGGRGGGLQIMEQQTAVDYPGWQE
jgi:hypothetical protein